jgi:hypothetical protein
MDTIDSHAIFAVALGFMAGFVVTAFCARWVGLFLSALVRATNKPTTSISARLRRFGEPAVLLLHPGGWILFGIIPFFAYRFIWVRPTRDSRLFFGFLLFSVVFQVVLANVAIRRARRKRANLKSQ